MSGEAVTSRGNAEVEMPYVGQHSSLTVSDALLRDLGSAARLLEQQAAVPFGNAASVTVLIVVLGLAIALLWPFRLWLLKRLAVLMSRSHDDVELAPYAKAVAAVVLTTTLASTVAQIVLAAFQAALPLLPATKAIAGSLAAAVAFGGFGLGLGNALRSPENKAYRPVKLPAGMGRVIGFYPLAASVMLGLTGVIDKITRTLQATATSWTIAQSLIVVAEATVIAWFLILVGQVRERQIGNAKVDPNAEPLPTVFGLTGLIWAALLVGVGAMLIGRTRFAMLIMQELLWAALILTTAWLLTRFLDALVARLFDTKRRAGKFATSVVGVQQARMAQAALIGSAVLTIAVWLVATGLIVAPLQNGGTSVAEQARPAPMLEWARSLDISPRTITIAMAVLFGGIALTRASRRWLENRFLPATTLDIGARTSIVTGLTYVGIIAAMLGATSALGVQLEKITLIASALSVGIGFGLQSIIQNFVSGLILLIERPVKLGDWVSVGGAEGNIRKIRVRATELMTADGSVSIVPNSAFISSTVANRADTSMSTRLDLSLNIAGCDSATEARDRLQDIVWRCSILRDDPKPRIYLKTLGDGAWTFDLRAYGKSHHSLPRVRSELLFWVSEQAMRQNLKIMLA